MIDIGDEQSIDDDLSTYSSHLLNMKNMLAGASNRTLVLIDEFGSGTEPIIGGAIAESILERLRSKGCYGVITTHYANIKYYASNTEGIANGAMMFDVQNIRPLFRLEIGKPGSSFAVEIARKIGLPEDIIRDAGERPAAIISTSRNSCVKSPVTNITGSRSATASGSPTARSRSWNRPMPTSFRASGRSARKS